MKSLTTLLRQTNQAVKKWTGTYRASYLLFLEIGLGVGIVLGVYLIIKIFL
ncbi:hypothetical protein [Marinoscillum furvescens]|uniref:hypothetical protein n=1 Tax=Marinoscillum furvescens TaxID=1026 RepID=UPI0014740AC2|nr:hypothetical protein [Marinoscillum furvescens]